jgi:hypothetical protein
VTICCLVEVHASIGFPYEKIVARIFDGDSCYLDFSIGKSDNSRVRRLMV